MKKLLIITIFLSVINSWSQEENYTIKNITANKKTQDFGVSYYGDSIVVFSSAVKGVFMKRVWSNNQEPFLSLFQGDISSQGEIINIKHFGNKIDSKYHEANLTFTKDLKTVYFSRNNYDHKKYRNSKKGSNLIQLYRAEINDQGNWTNITRLSFNSNEFSSGHPVLNKDESKLYFISNRPGSYGETDIYFVDINADKTYGEPKNLGAKVNTSKKEMFPFIDDNNILYFSSNGYTNNKGGLDVYVTKMNNKGDYYKPKNLGFPINSNKDDFAFIKQKGKKIGYFSSNRIDGRGDDDIYALTELKAPYFDCPVTIKGIVTSSKNNKVLPLTKVTLYHNNEELASMITDNFGAFNFEVQCNSNYKIIASKKHFEQGIQKVDKESDGLIELAVVLNLEKNDHFVKVRNQVMLNIAPIYFDRDKATLQHISEKELQTVVDIMNKYPEILIQIRAHTDSRGRDNYNFILSDKRAKVAMNWIVKNGIHKDRILAVGFGEEQLVNACKNGAKCSEEEHLKNRRTEFVILNPVVLGH